MPTSNLRRLRGALGLAVTWGVTWAIAAGLIGGLATSAVLILSGHFPPVPLLIGAFGLAGGISGFVSGAGFALLLTTSARRRTLDDINPIQFGILGAIPAAVVGWLLFHQAGLALVATGFGFVAATGSLVLARRANVRELEADEKRLALESGHDR